MPKHSTANSVKPHTEEKLRFYTSYLERYLPILLRSKYISKINIYDMYCGAGIYLDGKKGSAVRAVDSIWKAKAAGTKNVPINLHLNDLDQNKIFRIKTALCRRDSSDRKISISYSSLEAETLISKLPNGIASQASTVRNLVFIDPYGYKSINKNSLIELLRNNRTEIILFLPIEQMYRFKNRAAEEEVDVSLKPLKSFLDQFEIDIQEIESEADFVKAVEMALCFNNNLHSASYKITNHTGHLYGIFFVTPNIYGLEKILEVKWHLDDQGGDTYRGNSQKDFVIVLEKQTELELLLTNILSESPLTNIEVYEQIISAGFLPKHANEVLRNWQALGRLEACNTISNVAARKNTFKLSYRHYKSGQPEISMSLRQ